jgi:maltooligosyltrehalose trehalohydrolase
VGDEATLGALSLGENRCSFRVWAPLIREVEVHVVSPGERLIPLRRERQGYHQEVAEGIAPGTLYRYRLDGEKERPDPASRFQPQGVHGPSQVVDRHFTWEDSSWCGLPLRDYLIYELHVGTFTPEGTFVAVIPRLEELRRLGITAVEIMPIAQFPGTRNWGYDGAYPFAVQDSYGGPHDFKRLVNACHQQGLAVVLDVVCNHLGPEGNYLGDFGPYFTDRYRGPWGQALNFDGPYSDEVRRFFIENALSWVTEFHVDALRIDAVHGILDFSAKPFLHELAEAVHEQAERLNRRIYLIPESDLNDTKLVHPPELGGFGLDAQWNDDFHHALHTLLTGERTGYYEDFGQVRHLVKAFREGFVYSGEYSPYRRRRHGNSSRSIPADRLVVFAQNHDQVGNRLRGDRLSRLLSFEGLKLTAGVVLLSPFIPLLFMGEEYGETAPFEYFISHSDPSLIEAVRRGRREEFSAFHWQGEPSDPQDEATFLRCKLDHDLRRQGAHGVLMDFHRELIRLRREIPAFRAPSTEHLKAHGLERERVLVLRRRSGTHEAAAIFHFGKVRNSVAVSLPVGRWRKVLDSADSCWQGPGSTVPLEVPSEGSISVTLAPLALVVFLREEEVAE